MDSHTTFAPPLTGGDVLKKLYLVSINRVSYPIIQFMQLTFENFLFHFGIILKKYSRKFGEVEMCCTFAARLKRKR